MKRQQICFDVVFTEDLDRSKSPVLKAQKPITETTGEKTVSPDVSTAAQPNAEFDEQQKKPPIKIKLRVKRKSRDASSPGVSSDPNSDSAVTEASSAHKRKKHVDEGEQHR